MRKLPLLIVLLLLVTCIPSVDAEHESVRMTGVLPTSSFEGIEITNYGCDVDLANYSIGDGEGTVGFSSSIILNKGESLWILKAEPADWFRPDNYLVIGNNGITSNKYALADKGDDIYLYHGGVLIDTFVYGEMDGTYDGWNGSPFDKLSKNSYAVRDSFFDTDSANDWKVIIPGRDYEIEFGQFECNVETFVFPDCKGYPIMKTLLDAKEEIDISVYTLAQKDVVSVLLSKLKDNVEVNILCDGSPVGGINDSELKALATLSDNGANVHLIKQNDDGFKRYTYLHNKYAVVDDCKVIITSENWVDSSFSGNRGWGMIAESEGYAELMRFIFFNDFNITNSDVFGFRELYPKEKSTEYNSDMEFDYERSVFNAVIEPVVSPDNSLESMRELILNAKDRIYSEQLDVQYSWLSKNDNPLQWMLTQSNKGLDCRLLLDVTFDSDEDEDLEDGYGIIDSLSDTNLQCKTVNGDFSVVHNKGVIVDDSVWLGSVNWTYTSFNCNRESAVIIHSDEVAEYYSKYYLSDWGLDCDSIIPKIVVKGELREGQSFLLDASESVVNCNSVFQWDTDGDGVFERTGTSIMLTLSQGHHNVTLMITDEEGNVVTKDYSFDISGNGPNFDLKYVPLIVLCAMILLIKAFKKFRERCR